MRRFPGAMVCLGAVVWNAGCGGSDEPPAGAAVPTAQPAAVAAVQTVQKPAVIAPALALRLRPGQRFPLRKVVEQTLTQQSATGPAVSRTRLELWLTLTVEEVTGDRRTRLRAEYQRVAYRHEMPGELFEFDSARPGTPVPLDLVPCRGAVGEGFSFWISPEHRMAQVLGFREFLERTARDVPAEHRMSVLDRFARLVDTAEFANVVDDGIGLLPPGGGGNGGAGGGHRGEPAVGSTWSHERRLGRALPLHLASQCTLRDLNEHAAEIDIAGHVRPTAAIEPVTGTDPAGGLRLTVRGGHVTGHCTIDRATGLPLHSQIERHVEMLVEPASGPPFVQHKQLVTTIEAFPEQPDSRAARLRQASAAPGESAAAASGEAARR